MGFETLQLNDIVAGATGEAQPLPEAEYVLRLISVGPNKFQEGGLSFDIAVDEGKYARRRIFPSLPAPTDEKPWSANAIALLAKSMGVDQNPGETVVEALNRAAGNGHAKFVGTTKQYVKSNGEVKADLNWFSVKPAIG